MPNHPEKLSRETILAALARLDELLREKGVSGELCVFGGAAMALAFDVIPTTRVVDAISVSKNEVLDCAKQVSDEMPVEIHWFDDDVKGFVSPNGQITSADMPEFSNLRIMRPSTEYLLAVECMNCRIASYADHNDFFAARVICNKLGITQSEDVMRIIHHYYSNDQIHDRTRYFVEEIFYREKTTSNIYDQRTLAEVMSHVQERDDYTYGLKNFIDEFRSNPRVELLKESPPLLTKKLNDDGLADAYIASAAAHLCQLNNFPQPTWINQKCRIKKIPWFAAKSPNLKAILLQESPAAFRVRNLFVSANALSRA